MIIRFVFAIICSLVLLGLIPFLNKTRSSKEIPIISYRLHSFETKNTPAPLPEPKLEEEVKLEKAIEMAVALPKPKLLPTAMPINTMIASNLKFSASLVGVYEKGMAGVAVELPIKPLTKDIVFQADGGDHLLYGPKPITPLRAKQLGLSGVVTAEFEVNEKGLVDTVKVINSSNDIFNKSVMNAVKQYRFKPFLDQNGNPVKVLLTKEFQFEVQ